MPFERADARGSNASEPTSHQVCEWTGEPEKRFGDLNTKGAD
jgi:hypothetical protein